MIRRGFCFTLGHCLPIPRVRHEKNPVIVGIALVTCCLPNPICPATDSTDTSTVVDSHTAENALDWPGRYAGLLPCADCEGIQTQLTLNADKTYVLEEHYVKNGRALHPSKATGRFQFDAKKPSLIRLENTSPTRVYFIGEGYAEARDAQSRDKISSQLNYRLQQTP